MHGDAARLTQLVSNLLNNAAKYTDPGGSVVLTVDRHGSDVVLTVVDNGVGIPPDMLRRVFDPFIQVGAARDHAIGGLGLGLTLVKRLVEMHGGSVEAHSDGQGKGSSFVVRLPALPAASGDGPAARTMVVAAEPPPAPLDHRVPDRRILVVDDVVDAGQSLARMLELAEYHVWVVHDGPSALEAVDRLHPHVVFLDIGMPEMDGLEVGRRLRARFGRDAMWSWPRRASGATRTADGPGRPASTATS